MKKIRFNKLLIVVAVVFAITSCIDDLNVTPIDPSEETAINAFNDLNAYRQVLAKIYGGLALTGQSGPDGTPDIQGIDEGFSSYLRMLWYHQVLTTDEAVIGWNDQTIKDFHNQNWGASDIFIQGMYSRIYYQIALINQFVRETSPSVLNSRNIPENLRGEIAVYRAEARLIRAFCYWHAMDLFGNVPFITEEHAVGAFLPDQIMRPDLFAYVEAELLDIEDELLPPNQNEYGRADRAAAWMILAKIYLNAQVYANTNRYADARIYAEKVINPANGFELTQHYRENFLADNETSKEIIFRVAYDGENTKTWGGTTFVTNAAVGGNMDKAVFGIPNGGWGGTRTTSALVSKFSDISGNTDTRAMFHTDGQSLEINDVSVFTDGYAITKWRNVRKDGSRGKDGVHVDIDYPIFRLADAYLMYAEAVLRGGGGSMSEALEYVNKVRNRAYRGASGHITSQQLNLEFILDERARELYWEGHRRTDLIRYGRFSNTDYVWPWKGGVKEGTSVNSRYDLFPIPASDRAANPKLVQNTGY